MEGQISSEVLADMRVMMEASRTHTTTHAQIHIDALPGMSDAQGKTFQQGAVRYCAAVG